MENLAKVFVSFAVCLGVADRASAIDMSRPYVAFSIPEKPVHLGEATGPGVKEVGAKLTAHVEANCPYRVMATFEGLKHRRRGTPIAPEHTTVTINGKAVAVGEKRVPVAVQGPTPRGGVDVPIELQVAVTGLTKYPAGRYAGTLVITIMAGP